MIKSNQIFIPIPKARDTHYKIEIAGDDVTYRAKESFVSKPVTSGIGTFSLKLSNLGGRISGLYSVGDIVKFYGDNSDGSTLQFYGRIDFVKDNIDRGEQNLEIEGRHRAYLLTESLVCYTATETATSTILKDIIGQLPASYGFTYNDVATTTDSMSVNWNYKPFWQCVNEICGFAGYDCYVDDNLDFNYFEANSIENTEDSIVEGQTFISTKDWGTNDYYEKTRVTAIGKNDDGLPIIYTAISEDEGNDKREVIVRDASLDTRDKVKNLAEANLEKYTNRTPQATVAAYGLESVNPGENIWIIVPRQKIQGQYKIIEIIHKFGSQVGGWKTDVAIEEKSFEISSAIQSVSQQATSTVVADNINKLNNSVNYEFESEDGTHITTEITEGVLKTTGGASGTWISSSNILEDNATSFELRVFGESLPGTTYYASSDAGVTWQEITSLKTKYAFNIPGKFLSLKIVLASASTQVSSAALLYS